MEDSQCDIKAVTEASRREIGWKLGGKTVPKGTQAKVKCKCGLNTKLTRW